jgi:hypothetical protein
MHGPLDVKWHFFPLKWSYNFVAGFNPPNNKLGFMAYFRNSLFFVQFWKVNGFTEFTACENILTLQTWAAGTTEGMKGGLSIQLPR